MGAVSLGLGSAGGRAASCLGICQQIHPMHSFRGPCLRQTPKQWGLQLDGSGGVVTLVLNGVPEGLAVPGAVTLTGCG